MQMKPLKASIFLSLLAILASFSFSGCFTQISFGTEESAYADSLAAPNNQVSGPVYIVEPSPYWHTQRQYVPLPLAGAALPSATATSQPQSPHRESGNQRSSAPAQNDNSRNQSGTPQTSQTSSSNTRRRESPPASGSVTRTSGPTRGGR